MLVLSREQNEKIIIGDDVWIIFLGMRGQKAKIGFLAPKELLIYREEIYYRIKAKQQERREW
jgi:carbon storage regulator